MFKNYLKIAFRALLRQKLYSAINVTGLALGISCTIIVAVLLQFDLSFNTMYPKKDRLYRVVTDETNSSGAVGKSSSSPGAIGEAMVKEFPEVEQATVVLVDQEGLFAVRTGNIEKKFKVDQGVIHAFPAFLHMFDIPMIAGTPALNEPNTVVLTRSVAKRFFGEEPAIGNTIRWENKTDLRVVGVTPDPPSNSDLDFTVVISGSELKKTDAWMFDWRNLSSNVQTFVLLRNGASVAHVNAQFPRFKDEYMQNVLYKREHHLQALKDMHYEPEYADIQRFVVSPATLSSLAVIGLLLILTACVNFVNMATAQAMNRAREIGVRKVLGADRKQISRQFLGETFLIVLISVMVSIAIVELALPPFTQALGIPVHLDLLDPWFLGFLVVLTCVTTVLSGSYPALLLSRYHPAAALTSKVSAGGRGLRRGLVTLQFMISQILIVGTVVVILQMHHIKSHDLGMQTEGVVTVPFPSDSVQAQTLKNQFREDPHVQSATYSWTSAISDNEWDTNAKVHIKGEVKVISTDLKFADADYLATYGLSLLAGRNYVQSDTMSEFIVNEAFVRSMQIQNPAEAIGTLIQIGKRQPMPIVGIVRNFNSRSLHEYIHPCLLAANKNAYSEIGIKIRSSDVHSTLAHIEKIWTATFPSRLFESKSLDERIASMYKQETRIEFLFGVFAPIAILIGCIGLFGLISFVAAQKTKEIGVRKVLGASIASILMMFSKEFLQLIVAAFLVAAPISYFVMNRWLDNFAYRITLGPSVFAVAIAVTVLVATITVGYRAIKAATTNPVESLRYE